MNITRPRRTPEKRNSINDPRYNTRRWQRKRAEILARDNHLCQCTDCKESGRITIAGVVDHIKQVTRGGEFYENSNLKSMAVSCHQRKSAKERRR